MRIKMNNISVVDLIQSILRNASIIGTLLKNGVVDKQRKKKYAPRNSTNRERSTFNVNDLTSKSDSLDTSDEE